VSSPKCKITAELLERSRVGETATFLKRAMLFLEDLKKKRYPNASTLARVSGCSRSTAMRTIDRLRYEFGVPIEYEDTHRGYYLTQSDYTLSILPPSREELLVLCLVSDLALLIGDTSVQGAMDAFWARVAMGRSDIERDRFRKRFKIEAQELSRMSGVDLLGLLVMCHQDHLVSVSYRSPWSDAGEIEYVGRFERVRVTHGRTHVLFACSDGTNVVLNASFIDSVKVVHNQNIEHLLGCPVRYPDGHWYAGDGGWSGATTELIEVSIAAPASRYYGSQIWHIAQEDSWDGETLIRRFPSVISAELAGRILSLGRAVVSVRPAAVLEQLQRDVENLNRLCATPEVVETG
jgi:biotin operon repressor